MLKGKIKGEVMSKKLNIALYWAASCGGCEVAVLDTNEKILELVEVANIVLWPVAIDTKYKDVRAMGDGSIDITLFNGAIRSEENREMAELLREKSKLLIAFGSCAVDGCIPGLANLSKREEVLENAFKRTVTTDNPEGIMPELVYGDRKLTLPELEPRVSTLEQVVTVDAFVPGCPPPPELIASFIDMVTAGKKIPFGANLAPDISVCEDCDRNPKEEKILPDIIRPHRLKEDNGDCFLLQGVLCMGPVTRSGCSTRCINANFPCTGCMGPTSKVTDQGARFISAIGSILGGEETDNDIEKIKELVDKIDDPVGTFYMYNLASSIVGGKKWRD